MVSCSCCSSGNFFFFRPRLRKLSFLHQISLHKGAPPPILDTSSSLLLFSAASDIAGVRGAASSSRSQSSFGTDAIASAQKSVDTLSVLIGRVSALLESQKFSSSRTTNDETVSAAGLEAALIITFQALNDSEREKLVSELNHSMVFVLLHAASGAHGMLLLQRFALMSLAGISMSNSGRRMLLSDATPPVTPLMDVLAGGELHSAALAALVLGNLALEPAALAALDRCAAVFAREVVSLMSCEQVSLPACGIFDENLTFPCPRPTLFVSLWEQYEMWQSAASSGYHIYYSHRSRRCIVFCATCVSWHELSFLIDAGATFWLGIRSSGCCRLFHP